MECELISLEEGNVQSGDLVKERSCTDIFFLYLFGIFVAFLIIAVGITAAVSNPKLLISNLDDHGNICGVRNEPIPLVRGSGQDMTDKEFLLKRTKCLGLECFSKKRCVAKCPEGTKEVPIKLCVYMKHTSSDDINVDIPFLQKVGSDISTCWVQILILFVLGIVFSVALILVFRFYAATVIWIVLVVVAIVAVLLTIFVWVKWKIVISNYSSEKDSKTESSFWLAGVIFASILTPVYFWLVFIMRKRIAWLAALFREAGKAVTAMPLIILQPIYTTFFAVLVCSFTVIGFLCVQSSGTPTVDTIGNVTYEISIFFKVLQWILLFGCFWMMQFVFACQHLVVSGSVSIWYFTRDKELLSRPISRSLKNAIRYHLGSAAMGSLILGIIQIIRLLIKYLRKVGERKHNIFGFLMKLCDCFLGCFEGIIAFLARRAYIMIAMYGEGFCTSARRALSLLVANLGKLVVLESVGDFVLIVIKVSVSLIIALIGLALVQEVEGVHYICIPIGFGVLFAFITLECFLSVYEMAVDTLLLCFCDDFDKNDGITKPCYMTKSQMEFLDSVVNETDQTPVQTPV